MPANFISYQKLFLAFALTVCVGVSPAQSIQQLKKQQQWEKKKIAKGLKLYTWHIDALFDSQQSISVLQIKKNRKFSIAYESTALKPTSQFAQETKALAAVNAGFFNMKNGGSVSYLKVGDEIIAENASTNPVITTHAIAITRNGRLKIVSNPKVKELESERSIEYVLFTGPLLLQDGQAGDLPDNNFSNRRHPRTCACTRNNGQSLLVTIDGRNAKAQGMSLEELTELLKLLKCKQAINLDGGGSTTMWVVGQGVVNHPSDNKKFDTAGERRVANAILVH
ncbi:MAG: phosphodiester glycosidase family protein [Saprospiraceae bacterium]|nr:phosphodiester glycosidase family protein [Saprospiraceae bacterium]